MDTAVLSQGPACPQGCPGLWRVAGTTHTTCYCSAPVPAMEADTGDKSGHRAEGGSCPWHPAVHLQQRPAASEAGHTTLCGLISSAPPSGPARGLRCRLSTIHQPRLAGPSRQSGQHVDPTLQGSQRGSSPSGTARQAAGQAQMPVNKAESLLSMHSLPAEGREREVDRRRPAPCARPACPGAQPARTHTWPRSRCLPDP